MKLFPVFNRLASYSLAAALAGGSAAAMAADQELLDILLGNGVITQAQYDRLMKKDSLTSKDILGGGEPAPPAADSALDDKVDTAVARAVDKHLDEQAEARVVDKVAQRLEEDFPVKASYGSKGFRLESRDGKWQTNLQWRAQLRYTNPYNGDPRQVSDFTSEDESSFEARRLRMKIGGHGYQPWLKYYFEVDLQPSRDVDDDTVPPGPRGG